MTLFEVCLRVIHKNENAKLVTVPSLTTVYRFQSLPTISLL